MIRNLWVLGAYLAISIVFHGIAVSQVSLKELLDGPCPTEEHSDAIGASSDTPLKTNFGVFHASALAHVNGESDAWVNRDEAEPNCKWVRLSGYFRSTKYYHYQGHLFQNVKDFNEGKRGYFLIDSFASRDNSYQDLHSRHVTLIGLYYDTCAYTHNVMERAGQMPIIMSGPCHYGKARGLTLRNVIIEAVRDDAPLRITGEEKRNIYKNLAIYTHDDLNELELATRDWISAVQQGPYAYATRLNQLNNWHGKQGERIRKSVIDPKSIITDLSGRETFQQLVPNNAEIRIFTHWPYEKEPNRKLDIAIGCVCLVDSCAENWPLFRYDTTFPDPDYACNDLQRSPKNPSPYNPDEGLIVTDEVVAELRERLDGEKVWRWR